MAQPPLSGTITLHSPVRLRGRKPMPFADVSLPVPVLGVKQVSHGFITGAWIGLITQLIVTYKADGKGLEVIPDANMMPVAVHSLWTAVAEGYSQWALPRHCSAIQFSRTFACPVQLSRISKSGPWEDYS
jgi:hypothetical protein